MTFALGILTFVVVLAVLILVHELGHFTVAKLCGVRVEEFGLGFPPRVKSWKRAGTVYSLNAVPIGGFVKMLGENGENAELDSFGAKPPWQRFLILVAGPFMNLLLAVSIFFVVFLGGSPRGLTVVTKVANGSPAATAGVVPGDRITQIDGQPVRYYDDLETVIQNDLGRRVSLRIQRGNHQLRTGLLLRSNPPKNQGPMGIQLGKSVTVAYGPLPAAGLAVGQVRAMVLSIPALVQTVSQHGSSGVAGPIGIAHITTNVVQNEPKQGPGSLLQLVALLSANLGVLNLLPVPALDGGRLVFVLISWVRRRNLDPEIEGLIHMVGMAVLLLLILLISYQDVLRWVSGATF